MDIEGFYKAMDQGIDESSAYINLIKQTKLLVSMFSDFVLGEFTGYGIGKFEKKSELYFHKYGIEAVTYGDGSWELFYLCSKHKVLYGKRESPEEFANFLEGFLLGYECRKVNSLGGNPPSLPLE